MRAKNTSNNSISGVINDFMSWNIWIPFGRLSYSAYLVHFCVMFYVIAMGNEAPVFSGFSQAVSKNFFSVYYIFPRSKERLCLSSIFCRSRDQK